MTPTQKLIEAAETAVEALRYYETESFDGYANPNGAAAADASTALRTALQSLREAQAEPVATVVSASDFEGRVKWRRAGHQPQLGTDLYATPPSPTPQPAQKP